MHKKAVINPIMWVVVAVAVLMVIFILFSRGAFGLPKITSLTPKASGYNKDTCKDKGVVVSGFVNVVDSAFIDIEPSIKEVTVDEVLIDGQNALIINPFSEGFNYKVTAVDELTNNVLDISTGSGLLTDRQLSTNAPYSVNFIVPDNNCDGAIDDFNLKLKAELSGRDIGKVKTFEKLIRFRNGRVAK